MTSPAVLFVGGTGKISSACVVRAIERGFDVCVLNRNQTSVRPLPKDVTRLTADIRDAPAARKAIADRHFDAVVDFTIRDPEHAQSDIDIFKDRTGQFVFISSASAYQKPVARLPITESTPLVNPYWDYSRRKIACEERLLREYREHGFPATIVRPSHTYDRTLLPFDGGWTVVDRMRKGKPVVVHGDGTSLWVLTHHDDFARAFVRLLANPLTIGDAFHITSDEVLTWDQNPSPGSCGSRRRRTAPRPCGVRDDRKGAPRLARPWSATRRTRLSSTTPKSNASPLVGRRRSRLPKGRAR